MDLHSDRTRPGRDIGPGAKMSSRLVLLALALSTMGGMPALSAQETPRTRLVLLGTGTPNPDPERVTEARQSIAWLVGAVAALPLAQREVLLLTTVVGLQQREVSDSLNLPLNRRPPLVIPRFATAPSRLRPPSSG